LQCGELVGPFHPQTGIDIEQVSLVDYALMEEHDEKRRRENEASRERDRLDRHLLYEGYLKSPRWQEVREKVFRRDGGLCQGCLQAQATEVHHMSYDHAFNELAFELVSVCRDCHERIHGLGERRRFDVSQQLSQGYRRAVGSSAR